MKWSPPRIERRKMFCAVSARLHMTAVGFFVGSAMLSGCASLPAMSSRPAESLVAAPSREPYTADELARIAAMPAVPVFDVEKPATAMAAAVTSEAVASTVSSLPTAIEPVSVPSANVTGPATPAVSPSAAMTDVAKKDDAKKDDAKKDDAKLDVAMSNDKGDVAKSDSADVPKPMDPAPSVVKSLEPAVAKSDVAATDATKSEPQKADGSKIETNSPDVAKSSSEEAPKSDPAAAPKVEVALGGGANKNSNARSDAGIANKNAGQKKSPEETPRVAKSKPSGVLVKPPESFAWKKSGKSSGSRPFQTVHLGDEGYRTLVIGSVGGNDPLALELVDRLARHLHEDSLILGGFDCTIIRTINPDGEANRKYLNEKGDYVNSGFPKGLAEASKVQMPEAKFVLEQIDTLKPQRVVHIRSVEGGTGVIATGFSSQTAAREASEWLKFKMLMLPERSNPGSLERYVSTSGLSDVITVGIPDTTPKGEVWSLYGDTILNLLMAEDFASREIARKQ